MPETNQHMITRIKTSMRKRGINARELAERAEVGRSFVYDILNGKSANPTTKKLFAVANVLDVSVPYLLQGEGGGNYTPPEISGDNENSSTVFIPAIKLTMTSGAAAVVTEDSEDNLYPFKNSWINETIGRNKVDLRVFFVEDEGMQPTLLKNDMVLVDINQKKPKDGGIFLIFDDKNLLPRRLSAYNKNRQGKLLIATDNKLLPDYEMSRSEVKILGKLVWFSRKI